MKRHTPNAVAVQRRDRPWVDAYATVLCGPLAMPSVEALRQAVAALAARYPESRLTWRLDPEKRYWLNDRTAETIVTEGVWDDDVEVGQHLDTIAGDSSLQTPLALIRYHNHLGVKMSHGLGDARLFVTVIAAVLHSAIAGEVVPWPAEPGPKFPLVAAAWRTFGKHPKAIRATIDDRRSNSIAEVDGQPPVMKPWAPSRRTINITMPREQGDEIVAWGQKFAPGASRFGLQAAFVLRALKRVGIDVADDVRIVVDLRKYLGWKYIDGNLVAGVSMKIDSSMSPDLISAKVKATIRSGRPLAGHMVASTYGFTATPDITAVNVNERPRVTFTDVGHQPVIDALPFLPDAPIVWSASVQPEGPMGLTIMTGETQRLMGVVTTFHDNVVNADLVNQAMQMMKTDPIRLLSADEARR
jgi:hypothetical protein